MYLFGKETDRANDFLSGGGSNSHAPGKGVGFIFAE
jgi:hypothetical protein